jgi:hypothetical protein
MGHKHINSLKETVLTPSQECVERHSLPGNVRNGANRQKTDVSPQETVTATYANMTREGVQRKPLESVRKAFLSRINPILRTIKLTLFVDPFLCRPCINTATN